MPWRSHVFGRSRRVILDQGRTRGDEFGERPSRKCEIMNLLTLMPTYNEEANSALPYVAALPAVPSTSITSASIDTTQSRLPASTDPFTLPA